MLREKVVLPTLLCGALLVFSGSTSWAAPIDLSAGGSSSATINGAVFQKSDPNTGAGSGSIGAFLRTQNDPSEAGFNTDGTPSLDTKGGAHTHSLQLGDLTVVDFGGNDFFELRLDVNEPNKPKDGEKSLITLQNLELWVNTTTGADNDYSDGLGTKVYGLNLPPDASTITMEDLGNGSGSFDYDVLFPVAILSGFATDDYLYLYNSFGNTDMMSDPSEGGFEEWAARTGGSNTVNPPAAVPIPNAALLFGTGLLGLIVMAKRKKSHHVK